MQPERGCAVVFIAINASIPPTPKSMFEHSDLNLFSQQKLRSLQFSPRFHCHMIPFIMITRDCNFPKIHRRYRG